MPKKRYDKEYKVQAVKLNKRERDAESIKRAGSSNKHNEGMDNTCRQGQLDLGEVSYTPKGALSLAEEIAVLRKQNKELSRANRRLQEENEFLEEASAFFAASRRKSAKTRD